jgi:hypothetical protein
MDKRYQVFVSSTYADLKEERGHVIEELTRVGFIAIGMEQFPAADEDKFEFIKRIIEESDYYIVIIRGKYGSVDVDEVSYTEKEFNYAVEIGRPCLAFIFGDRDNLPVKDIDSETAKQDKLRVFVEKLEQRRIVRHWKDGQQLIGFIKDSLNDASRQHPGIGWVRGDQVIDPRVVNDLETSRRQAEVLEQENARLKKLLHSEKEITTKDETLEQGADPFSVEAVISTKEDLKGHWTDGKLHLVVTTYEKGRIFLEAD